MKCINSYKIKLININNCLTDTISIYRKALSFLVKVLNDEYDNVKDLSGKDLNNFVEKLIHKTKTNPNPKYDFDVKFYKYPSYLRRSTIADAYGIVSSYYSNLANYNEDRRKAIAKGNRFRQKPPALSFKHFKCPTLYKGNMFIRSNENAALVKIYKKKDWVWQTVKLRNQDVKYINKNCKNRKELSPILQKNGRKFYLTFAFENKSTFLTKKDEKVNNVISVDLGLNQSAVCSNVLSDGTVIARKFINQAIEKDRLERTLNRLRLKNKQSRLRKPKIWGKINSINKHIVNDTVNKIVDFALINHAQMIVFEYLNFSGKKPKNKAQMLQMWAKRTIQEKVEHKAHTFGIRVNRVSARNTSKLAFDGSGIVKRNKSNASLCTFKNKKQYNSDLNASYNIASRFFIKQLQKTTSVKVWSEFEAKVPQIMRRTQCTLSTFVLRGYRS